LIEDPDSRIDQQSKYELASLMTGVPNLDDSAAPPDILLWDDLRNLTSDSLTGDESEVEDHRYRERSEPPLSTLSRD
jgi:hypothetical protein